MIFKKLEKKSLAIIKLQFITLLVLLVAFLNYAFPSPAVIAINVVVSALFLFELFTETRKVFAKDFIAYAIFFLFLFVVVQANFASQFLPVEQVWLRLEIFSVSAVALLVFLLVFRLFFSRNYCFGTIVSSEKNSAVVEAEFDLLALINSGKYTVKASKKFKAGEKVKLHVKQGFFTRKPDEIIE